MSFTSDEHKPQVNVPNINSGRTYSSNNIDMRTLSQSISMMHVVPSTRVLCTCDERVTVPLIAIN
jgi:hypothetical protein